MPLIFIHGVNTRDTDPDYHISMAQRRKQFDDIVVAPRRRQYSKFAQSEDIYWGDLGVGFRWNLRCVPKTHLLQSLGPEDLEGDNPALMQLVSDTAHNQLLSGLPPASSVQMLGSATESHVFLNAIRTPPEGHRPGDVVRSIFAPEALRNDPRQLPSKSDFSVPQADLEQRGRQLAVLLQAAERVARQVDADPATLSREPNDDALLNRIAELVSQTYGDLFTAEAPPVNLAPGDKQMLGISLNSAAQWVGGRLGALVDGAKAVAAKIADEPARAATLLAMQGLREQVSGKGLRFFGDVLVYLYQGYDGPIARRVCDGIRTAAGIATANEEPLVVITHSFGSIIFYDALTSGKVPDIRVALWASAGAQTSLFSEMGLYHSSDPNLPTQVHPVLGRPAQVAKWINFYDAADILSYLHEPVFGASPEVGDIEVREGANASTAHGHYFLTPSFYERVAAEIPDHI
jgi:hypothetical protein